MSEENQTKPNLAQRLLAITEEIGTVAKDGRNEFQNYDYAREVDFVNALKPLLVKHGVIIIPEGQVTNLSPSGKDGKSTLTTIVMKYRIVNVDNQEDYYLAQAPGQGMDSSDKGVYKAITGAKKYFIANTFMVATGDDPEADGKAPVSKKSKSKPQIVPSAVNEDF